jgi:hypothetical protein
LLLLPHYCSSSIRLSCKHAVTSAFPIETGYESTKGLQASCVHCYNYSTDDTSA